MVKFAFVLLVLAALGRAPVRTVTELQEYYVATNGSDVGDGTLNNPWRTIGHALPYLTKGAVLNLREGTYYEHELSIGLQGTGDEPITIRSYPGERAVIDGGIAAFRQAPNNAWELVHGELGLYRSKQTFAEPGGFVGAWLLDDDVQLVAYESAANLESTNYGPLDGLAPIYMGPGVQLRSDGHIYIRLAYNPNDLTDASDSRIEPVPADTNPNDNRIAIFFSSYLFQLDGASHVVFEDVGFSHAKYIMDARNGSHHVTLKDCWLNFGNYGLVLREGTRDWEIANCEFSNGVPDYVYWTDVKNRGVDVTEAYPEFQSAAINGSMSGFHIHNNIFRDSFDGVTVDEGTSHAHIVGNVFRQIQDDAINLSKGIANVEVAYNMLWHVRGGISNLASNRAAGHVYLHHNVIDNSAYKRGGRPGNYRADNWPVWTIGSPFPGHDDGDKASWWKLYNNTIVTRQNVGYPWSPAGPDEVIGNPEKYVFNNVFFAFDDAVIFRDDHVTLGSHYDGNVFHRAGNDRMPLFTNFGDGDRYESLIEFQLQSGTDWEGNGLEIDPRFDLDSLNDPTYDPEVIWERYTPANVYTFSQGAPYVGLDWPGAEGVTYRGAIPGVFELLLFLPVFES